MRTLVAGVDSSTQSCKVVVRDAVTGELVREGRAPHPDGTEVNPQAWYDALTTAIAGAGGLADVSALAIGGQQHGMVLLDDEGSTIRDALLWNDNRSAPQAAAMVSELGARFWADAVGSVPVASFTVSKLRWLAEHEPANAARTAAVCLPHDWLTWRLAGGGASSASSPGSTTAGFTTDRGDASGTGYWSPATGNYRNDLLTAALGHLPTVPVVLPPAAAAGETRLLGQLGELVPNGMLLAAGTGDNMAAALGLSIIPGDVVVSIGTSGTVFASATTASADPAGEIAGFADATGHFLPLVCTLNAAQVLTAGAHVLGVNFAEFDRLALAAEPGAGGLVLLPYLAGERTPLRPNATGVLAGLTTTNMTPANVARATVEGMLCGLADAVDALIASGVQVDRILLIGGGAQSEAVRQIAPRLFGRSVLVPAPGEYVAEGAARQASWAVTGQLPVWAPAAAPARYEAEPTLFVRDAYAQLRD